MKAQDYYNQFPAKVFDAVKDSKLDTAGLVTALFNLFNEEAADIIDKRRIQKNSAVGSVVLELTQKWNVLVRMYEAKLGYSPIKKDGYLAAWLLEIPELKKYTDKKSR